MSKAIEAHFPVGDWPQDAAATSAQELAAWIERYTALGFGLLKNVPTPSPAWWPRSAIIWASCALDQLWALVRRHLRCRNLKQPRQHRFRSASVSIPDNPYRHPSPGVAASPLPANPVAARGDTLLVDGFHAAEITAEELEAPSLAVLSTVPMTLPLLR